MEGQICINSINTMDRLEKTGVYLILTTVLDEIQINSTTFILRNRHSCTFVIAVVFAYKVVQSSDNARVILYSPI